MKSQNQFFKCLVKGCSRVCPNYDSIYKHLRFSLEKNHSAAVKKSVDPKKSNKFGLSQYDNLFKVLSTDEVPKKLPVQYFKKGGSVKGINVECKYCAYRGTYENFMKHFTRTHKDSVADFKEGVRCLYENYCIWP